METFVEIDRRLLHVKDLLKDGVLSNRFNNRLEYCFSSQIIFTPEQFGGA